MPNAFLCGRYDPCDGFTERRAIQRCEDITGCVAIVGSSAGIIFSQDKSKPTYENKGLVNLRSFEQGHIMVFLRAAVRMFESPRNYKRL